MWERPAVNIALSHHVTVCEGVTKCHISTTVHVCPVLGMVGSGCGFSGQHCTGIAMCGEGEANSPYGTGITMCSEGEANSLCGTEITVCGGREACYQDCTEITVYMCGVRVVMSVEEMTSLWRGRGSQKASF